MPNEEPFPSRAEAVVVAFAMHAAGHERIVSDIAESVLAAREQGAGQWSK